jgi:hypothetical protein
VWATLLKECALRRLANSGPDVPTAVLTIVTAGVFTHAQPTCAQVPVAPLARYDGKCGSGLHFIYIKGSCRSIPRTALLHRLRETVSPFFKFHRGITASAANASGSLQTTLSNSAPGESTAPNIASSAGTVTIGTYRFPILIANFLCRHPENM